MLRNTIFAAASLAAMGTAALAAPVDPTMGTFGDLASVGSNVTFGGSGIPTNASNYKTYNDGNGNELILGLSITPRFAAPTPTNDGAGVYDVESGLSGGRTKWNFSFYAELIPANGSDLTMQNIGLELLYDLDSAANTDISDLGVINAGFFDPFNPLIAQDSQNLTFGYLSTGFPGFSTPGLNTFSPEYGEYSFLLRAANFTDYSDMGVAVIADAGPAPVPLPAGLPLLLAGLGGLTVLRRNNKKAA